MFGGPIMQVGQEQLEVEHNLVLLQMTLPAEGIRVDGITTGFSLGQLGL